MLLTLKHINKTNTYKLLQSVVVVQTLLVSVVAAQYLYVLMLTDVLLCCNREPEH